MEEQKNQEIKEENTNTDWLKDEEEELQKTAYSEDRSPALKLEENKPIELVVDFSNPFEVWKDPESKVVKKIIPVTVGEEKFVWWLNTRNPIYS